MEEKSSINLSVKMGLEPSDEINHSRENPNPWKLDSTGKEGKKKVRIKTAWFSTLREREKKNVRILSIQ